MAYIDVSTDRLLDIELSIYRLVESVITTVSCRYVYSFMFINRLVDIDIESRGRELFNGVTEENNTFGRLFCLCLLLCDTSAGARQWFVSKYFRCAFFDKPIK